MRRLIVLTAIAACSSLMVKAQKIGMTRFSLGAELSITTSTPVSTATGATTNSLGIGASIQAEHFYQENISGTILFGIISYIGKSKDAISNYKAYTVFPLMVGGRYYIGDGFHLGAQIGLGFATGGTAFAYSPQIGYNFKTSKGKSIDTDFKYVGYANNGTFSAIGIRIAYVL